MQQIVGLENMTEKSRLHCVTVITKYKEITSNTVNVLHVVLLEAPSYIHIVAGKYEHVCIE